MKVAVIMDDLKSIKVNKDTTFELMLALQRRKQCQLNYVRLSDVYVELNNNKHVVRAKSHLVNLVDREQNWCTFGEEQDFALDEMQLIFMRLDPPVDQNYIHLTHYLDYAYQRGVVVVNPPHCLRKYNEKLVTFNFPQYMRRTLVTSDLEKIREFVNQVGKVVLKPLDGMGGSSIFVSAKGDPNLGVVYETLIKLGSHILVQEYIEEIYRGDKRILVIDGEVIPYALSRIPQEFDHRGNLAVGGVGKVVELTKRDTEIAEHVAEWLHDQKILLGGIDIIGDSLTEINITSPTCMREIERASQLKIADKLIDAAVMQMQ